MKRLDGLPAAVLGQLLGAVGARVQAQAPPAWPPPRGAPGREPCPLIASVDGSTREARRQQPQGWRAHAGVVLGGKLRVMVEAFATAPCGRGLQTTRPRMPSAWWRRCWRHGPGAGGW